jgi:hypothetical protein
MAWVQHMIPTLKSALGSVPVTVSIKGSNIAQLANIPLDFYDLHYYSSPGEAYSILKQVKKDAGSTPVFIGEAGQSTYNNQPSTPGTTPLLESYQDVWLRSVELAAQKLGLGYTAPWAFQDYPVSVTTSCSPTPSTTASSCIQNFFGLRRIDGTAKPAFGSMTALFKAGTISTDINGDFSDGSYLDWRIGGNTYGTLSWDGTTGHDAAGSLEFTHTTIGPQEQLPNYNIIPVDNLNGSDQPVTVSVWAKTTAATGSNNVEIYWYGASGNNISDTTSSTITGTNDWTQLSVSGTPPSGATYFSIALQSSKNTGAVWYDDVSSSVN